MNRSDLALPIKENFFRKHILTMDQFDRLSIERLFVIATAQLENFLGHRASNHLVGKAVNLYFREPSTRTLLSFQRATTQLGGAIQIDFGAEHSSDAKGESFDDGLVMRGLYADTIVFRHHDPNAIYLAAAALAQAGLETRLINAGNGGDEHPTQALLDLFTIRRRRLPLGGLKIALIGDLKAGRTIHSLLRALACYDNVEVTLVEVPGLELPVEFGQTLPTLEFRQTTFEEALASNQVWYFTRTQKERAEVGCQVGSDFRLTREVAEKHAGPKTLIMHPLPRVGEIDPAVDAMPQTTYLWDQPVSGVAVRMALLSLINGE